MATFSCESGRSKAYSSDLKWRVVYQKCSLGLSNTEVAKRLNIDPSTVSRTIQLFEETGTVCSIQGYHENTCKKLSIYDELIIIEAVVNQPSLYLHEVQYIILKTTGNDLSIPTIYKFLQKQQFSRKKLTFRAQQRSDELRAKFLTNISIFEPEMLIFVDETGTDKRAALRKYGYALRGRPAISERLLVKGKRYSAIAGLHMSGMLDIHVTTESVDADIFCEYIEHCLLPYLLPFDGVNPNSVVVLDNATIHHVERAVNLIEETGAMVMFLPPHSPDIMPIEECFSKIKSYLRANDPLIQILTESEIKDMIISAFASITPNNCYSWIDHCGYMK